MKDNELAAYETDSDNDSVKPDPQPNKPKG
jgi:hypothetical protein